MKFSLCITVLGLFAAPLCAQSYTGFSSAGAQAQQACEAQLQALPTAAAFRAHLEQLTKEPHIGGTPANDRVGDYMATVMAEAGLTVDRYPYDVYLPDPQTEIDVALVTPIRLPLNNQEYVLKEDRFSDHPDLLPGWNAYSGSGDVTGEIVYANFGRREDFQRLEELGISVEGKIVIARYGGNFRGYKAKYAEAAGAIGLIIYTDPANGGYVSGPVYPEGRFASESTIQRGSLLTLDYTGDPLTPFEPALPRDGDVTVERLDPADVAFHTIPVAPLPYGSAKEILGRMTGSAVPAGWQGGLPFTYRLTGGSDLTVHLSVHQDLDFRRATNVVGTLEGSEFPDEWIVLGAHYDAWGFGAVDPNGGTAMLLTLSEALGQLAEAGCRPRRTIKIAHWDVEEYGIIGSAEWVEQLHDELTANGVAYINADAAVSGGNFGSSSSPSLKTLIMEAAQAVAYPGQDETVYDHWLRRANGAAEPNIGNLGGGSDHVGFYTHIGVPSAGLSMSSSSPIYHSNYDTFAWYERFGDTEFIYGPTLARVDGVLALRLANADLLPYDVERYAVDLMGHVQALERHATNQGTSYTFSRLKSAITNLEAATEAYTAARGRQLQQGAFTSATQKRVNAMLIGLEKAFISEEGLQGRRWSRSLYASPDPFSGYASWMLPGLRYEVNEGDAASVAVWETTYVEAVADLQRRVEALTTALNQ